MPPTHDVSELKALILENQRLLAENNEILKKLHKGHVRGMWLKAVWFFFIVIAPMILVYYYIAPMYSSMSGGTGGSVLKMQDVQELNSLLQGL
jgi:hypothetical protein